MRAKLLPLCFATVPLVLLMGCVSASKTPVYDSSQVGQMITSQSGEIIGVQDVVIKARGSQAGSPGVGSRMGSAAVTSAILGSPIHAAVAAGQALGGIAGASMDNQKGEELTILLKDGRTVVVVQERGEIPFAIGDRVRIQSGSSTSIYGEGNTHVVRDDGTGKSF